jgi:hypothetical protein
LDKGRPNHESEGGAEGLGEVRRPHLRLEGIVPLGRGMLILDNSPQFFSSSASFLYFKMKSIIGGVPEKYRFAFEIIRNGGLLEI